ncbi:class I SAM-dependent methyltransferase [Pseudomonas aeruginosa]|uniref:class I SAM-dependent methyltransferase n=1 Tax=Pseudomonas aeruginosa TaxID=287 RepID=UPI003967E3A0
MGKVRNATRPPPRSRRSTLALVRYLEGWPKRWNGSRTFLIQFAQDGKDLARFPSDAFDFAVVQAPGAEDLDLVVRQLIRVARQGLITRRILR